MYKEGRQIESFHRLMDDPESLAEVIQSLLSGAYEALEFRPHHPLQTEPASAHSCASVDNLPGRIPSEGEPMEPSRSGHAILFLWHPGTKDRFSGYGLVLTALHLVGLLMVDRPEPVDANWLETIERTFGSYQLSAMT